MAARARWGPRCKLDPGLNAPGCKVWWFKGYNSAFNLNPLHLNSRSYSEVETSQEKASEGGEKPKEKKGPPAR